MKKYTLIIILLILVSSCNIYQKTYVRMKVMKPEFTIVEINCELGYVVGFFECVDPPYKRQPCFDKQVFPLDRFVNPEIGQIISF